MAAVDAELIAQAKKARRMVATDFDDQVTLLLTAALSDLGFAGVEIPTELDAVVRQACITYFLMNFGEPDDYDRLKRSYDEQKAQLATATGYTDWGDL